MHFSQILIGSIFAATGLCAPTQNTQGFINVPLDEPLNWIGGSTIFPGDVIAGDNAVYSDYNATSWAQHCLNKCKAYSACTSSNSYSAINSGTPKERVWFCYVYRGGATTESDYVRDAEDGVEDSAAYTIMTE